MGSMHTGCTLSNQPCRAGVDHPHLTVWLHRRWEWAFSHSLIRAPYFFKGMDSMTTDPALPFVTVIMPIRNEANYIESSLGAVLAQDYPHHLLEVLISDGMSD